MHIPPILNSRSRRIAYIAGSIALLVFLGGTEFCVAKVSQHITAPSEALFSSSLTDLKNLHQTTLVLDQLHRSMAIATDNGLDVSTTTGALPAVLQNIKDGNYAAANSSIASLTKTLTTQENAAATLEAQKGTLNGTVTNGSSPLPGTTITLSQNGIVTSSLQADSTGAYSFHIIAGTYELDATLSGYTPLDIEETIAAGITLAHTIVLAPIPVPTPTPTPVPTPRPTPKPTPTPIPPQSSSTSDSSYYTATLTSSRGSFPAHIMSFELGPGKVKVMTDTASTTDCANNCPVQSVQSYVTQDGGFAGINGTYFCPADYSSCAGQVGSFFWKVLDSRTGKMINASDGLGENDPFLTFDASGNPRLFTSWDSYMSSGYTAYAGINHKPLIVNNGANVLDPSTLDSKQQTEKISRAAIAVKGSTLLVISISNATVIDLASAVQTMGVDYALNIDSGGSSGMYYNGSYRLGPGRAVPNALVFVQQ